MQIILISCNCSPKTFFYPNTNTFWRTDENLIQKIQTQAISEEDAIAQGLLIKVHDNWAECDRIYPTEKYSGEIIRGNKGIYKRWNSYKADVEEEFTIEDVDTSVPWTIESCWGKEYIKYYVKTPLQNLYISNINRFNDPFVHQEDL